MAQPTEALGDKILEQVQRLAELKYPGSCACRDAYALAYMQAIFRDVTRVGPEGMEASLNESLRIVEQKIATMEKL